MKTRDRGQVLVITAAALIVLLGIAALVVDLGFSWMLRRQEQNAADPGALAAARWIDDTTGATIDMANATDAACFYAHQSGFFGGPGSTAACTPGNDAEAATLVVNFPPDASAGQFAGQRATVQVIISRRHDIFFGRIFGQISATVTTQAVASRQRGNTNPHALVALNPDDCATANVHGNGSVRIYPAPGYTGDGGYVQVNSDCGSGTGDDACTNGTGALKIDGTADLYAPRVNVHGSCQSTADEPHGILDEGAAQIGDPLSSLVPPRFDTSAPGASCGVGGQPTLATGNRAKGCGTSQMPWQFSPDANCPGMLASFDCVELQPGVYYGGWNIDSKLHVKLAPGIYIIAGGGITIKSNGELDSIQAAGASPAPVLLFNTDNPLASCPAPGAGCQQDLTLGTATSKLRLTGLLPDQPCRPVTTSGGCPFGRMVIWHDADGSQGYDGEIAIQGGGYLFISGTIYAPTAFVDIEGNAGANCGTGTETQKAAVQIIAWEWRLGGSGQLCMPYDPNLLYKLPQQGLVH